MDLLGPPPPERVDLPVEWARDSIWRQVILRIVPGDGRPSYACTAGDLCQAVSGSLRDEVELVARGQQDRITHTTTNGQHWGVFRA